MVEEEIIIADDPPDYEAPPEYYEVIKNQASCSFTPKSPPPSYSNQEENEKWLKVGDFPKNFQHANNRRLVASHSDGDLERCLSFNLRDDEERNCVIKRSQSIESFMA